MNEKELVRLTIKGALNKHTHKYFVQTSLQICNHLIHSSYWQEARIIAITISRDLEVHTDQIIQQAWEQGKKIAVPRTDFINRTMSFYEITSFTDVEKQASGLLEPISDTHPIRADQFDLIIVPGLAFALDGSRLGYGGGFYDRFLSIVNAKTIALAFPCQLIKSVPTEEHDKKMDHIIGPTGFYL